MSSRARFGGLAYLASFFSHFLTSSFQLTALADERRRSSRHQLTMRPIRRLGGSTRFTQAGQHRRRAAEDVFAAADPERCPRSAGDGQPGREHRGSQQDPQLRHGDGNDDRANGTTLLWMALRRGGRPDISRQECAGMATSRSKAYQFVIDNLTETLTFFVPKICGNLLTD